MGRRALGVLVVAACNGASPAATDGPIPVVDAPPAVGDAAPADAAVPDASPPVPFVPWGFTLGGAERDEAQHVAVTSDGAVYVAGIFAGSVDFDPASGTAIPPA